MFALVMLVVIFGIHLFLNHAVKKENDMKNTLNKQRKEMDDNEISRLVYLLDALKVAPHKYVELIAIVERKNASLSFQKELKDLSESTDIVESCNRLREKLC